MELLESPGGVFAGCISSVSGKTAPGLGGKEGAGWGCSSWFVLLGAGNGSCFCELLVKGEWPQGSLALCSSPTHGNFNLDFWQFNIPLGVLKNVECGVGALRSMMLQSFTLLTRHLEVFLDQSPFKCTFFSALGLSNLSLSRQL